MKIKNVLISIIIIFCVCMVYAETIKLKVTADKANIRELPTKNSKSIMQIQKDTVLEATDKVGEWYVVTIPGKPAENGFISEKTVVKIEGIETTIDTPIIKTEHPKSKSEKTIKKEEKRQQSISTYKEKKKKMRIFGFGGLSMNNSTFTDVWTFPAYQEDGNFNGSYKIKSGLSFGGGVSFLFTNKMGVLALFNYFPGKESVDSTASIPHPFYYNQFREVTYTNDTLKYTELSIDADIIFAISSGKKMPVYVFGGVTIFNMTFDSISSFEWSESYPYDTAQITSVTIEQNKVKPIGFNAGVMINFMFSESAGINAIAAYSTGKGKVNEIEVTAGGFKVLGGIVIAF